jgi:hypothetical protein
MDSGYAFRGHRPPKLRDRRPIIVETLRFFLFLIACRFLFLGGRCTSVVGFFFRSYVTLSVLMEKLDAYERLRRASELLTMRSPVGDASLLLRAWEYLKGLRSDDFPEEIRTTFNFLEHEIARAANEDLSTREIIFLTEKLRKLEAEFNAARITSESV